MGDTGKATIDVVDYFWGWSLNLFISCYLCKLVNSRLVCVNKTDLCLTGCLKSDSSREETNGSALETGYQEQWDHCGHLHWLHWILLDPFELLDSKVLKACNPGNVSRNLLETASHLISVVGTQSLGSGSAHRCFGAAWGCYRVRKPWGCEPDLLPTDCYCV